MLHGCHVSFRSRINHIAGEKIRSGIPVRQERGSSFLDFGVHELTFVISHTKSSAIVISHTAPTTSTFHTPESFCFSMGGAVLGRRTAQTFVISHTENSGSTDHTPKSRGFSTDEGHLREARRSERYFTHHVAGFRQFAHRFSSVYTPRFVISHTGRF